jgi:hypothetical protein
MYQIPNRVWNDDSGSNQFQVIQCHPKLDLGSYQFQVIQCHPKLDLGSNQFRVIHR